MKEIKHKGTIKLETERLTLRRITMEDANQMFNNWTNDDRVTEFLTWNTHKTIESAKKFIEYSLNQYEKEDTYNWGIEIKDTHELIGTITAVNAFDDIFTVEIGYCIGYNYWGKGYVPEALSKIIQFLNSEVGYLRIEGIHFIENAKSGRVLEKCGFQCEGILRKRAKDKYGLMHDIKMYSYIFEPTN